MYLYCILLYGNNPYQWCTIYIFYCLCYFFKPSQRDFHEPTMTGNNLGVTYPKYRGYSQE